MTNTAWQEQQQGMLDRISREAGELARHAWLKLRDRLLREVAADQLSKRQVLDRCLAKYDKLSANYHRVTGTTYEGWTTYGPKAVWDELVAASHDDAVWDRLVERVANADPPARPPGRKARARAVEATPAQVADVVREIAARELMRELPTHYDGLSMQIAERLSKHVRDELERRTA